MQEDTLAEDLLDICRYELPPGRCVYLKLSLKAIVYEGQSDDLPILSRRLEGVLDFYEEDVSLSTQERSFASGPANLETTGRLRDRSDFPTDGLPKGAARGGKNELLL